jgi:predicted ArsR family transcriptional regulator
MENATKKTETTPLTDRQPMCDNDILRMLADRRGHTISEMIAHFHVTQTAILQRLRRLTSKEAVTREPVHATGKRGRPQFLYSITIKGETALAESTETENPAP